MQALSKEFPLRLKECSNYDYSDIYEMNNIAEWYMGEGAVV